MTTTIPFGKHKGRALVEVMAEDPQYVDWMMQQAWFAEKFKPLYELAKAGLGSGAENTPEHNAMQAKFLDTGYCKAVLLALGLGDQAAKTIISRVRGDADDTLSFRANEHLGTSHKDLSHRSSLRCGTAALKVLRGRTGEYARKQRQAILRAYLDIRKARTFRPTIKWGMDKAMFENISDVRFTVHWFADDFRHSFSTDHLWIELKPSLGDDYPAVIRQVKAQQQRAAVGARHHRPAPGTWVVLAGQFSAQGVTLDQARAMFAQSGIRLVLAAEVEAQRQTATEAGKGAA